MMEDILKRDLPNASKTSYMISITSGIIPEMGHVLQTDKFEMR